jgi:hypothetical protein
MDWAYDFTCDGRTIEAVRDALNAAGPWQWHLRENQYFGDYLSSGSVEHVWLRVHEYPCTGLLSTGPSPFSGLHGKGFKAMLHIDDGSIATRPDIDRLFRQLLQAIDAANATEIEPYD